MAAAIWAVGTFGLPGWLLADQHPVRNVLEGLSWPAGIVATLALGAPGLWRWMRGRSANLQPTLAERAPSPLVGRALHLVDGELPPVSAVGLLDLRVKPAIDTHAEDGSDLPPYVARDIDEDLEWAIHAGGIVLLHGPAAVGKSRAAAEALRRLRPNHKLLVPNGGPALREIADAGVDLSETVIWLDDLERYLGAEGLDVGLLQRLCPPGGTGIAMVATMRDEQLALHAHAATRSIADTSTGIDQAAVEVLAGVRGRRRIRVAAALTDTERTRAAQVGERDARVRRAVAAREGFAEYLAAGAAMMDRWSTGESPEFVRGQALISAAVDCRRAGHHDPVPVALLADLHTEFLPSVWRDRADLPSLDVGLHWATRRVLGASSCLQPTSDQHYLASDYLLDRAQQAHADSTAPLTGPVRDRTWSVLTAALTPTQNFRIGASAYFASRYDIAEQAFISGATSDPKALFYLGIVLDQQPGREAEAEQVFRDAIAAGDTRALNNLGILLAGQAGREAEAEEALRDAVASGDSKAPFNLGTWLSKQPGREAEAEAVLRGAFAEGTNKALTNLGILLGGQVGREAEAEGVLRDAVAAGEAKALFNLGTLLSKWPGREAEAEDVFREVVAAGNTGALNNLGVLLAGQVGREAEAEKVLRDAVASGETKALFNLGLLLSKRPGHEAEAEEVLRDAVTSGETKALFNLGLLLSKQPRREAEVEHVFREAVAVGDTRALNNLGVLLAEQSGREAEAEEIFREAVAAGDTRSLSNLGVLLAEQSGREAEAEHVFREAVAAGNTRVLDDLGVLLGGQAGREVEAEEFFREAVAAGNTDALFNLGVLLGGQTGRKSEAEEFFREAVAAGDTNALNYLGLLLAEQSGREAEAEKFFREAAAAGSSRALANLGLLLAQEPGREPEAELAYRDAIDAGHTDALNNLGVLLAGQAGREVEAEEFFREAVAAGNTDALSNLRLLLGEQPGSEAETEDFRAMPHPDVPTL
ncbi:tetratricopeptide repeat protein [Amycolatopsis pretoriensis]|uniref:tetratricopeptide repeat protein n=1 Tax=Amycolatopsis pretoriensis TaxID=218821 RepID=UPI000B89A10C|nr:tetratricopeptide repeat protein [Amycolatopsis pretoriensis]